MKHIATARIKGAGNRDLKTGIYPGVLNTTDRDHNSPRTCGYFVSVGKPKFSGANLQASLGLIVSQGYTCCHIVCAGTLQRWNIQSNYQIGEQRAYRASLIQENIWIDECIKTIKSVGETLSEVINVQESLMGDSADVEPSDGEILADVNKLTLKHEGYSQKQLLAFSKNNMVRAEIKQQLFSKQVTFIIHSWDSVRADERFRAYDSKYRDAIASNSNGSSSEKDWAIRFAKSRQLTTKNFMRRREKELKKTAGNAGAILGQYEINCPKFIDEETAVIPFFHESLSCERIFYAGVCIAHFQAAYEFFEIDTPKKLWLCINLKNITYIESELRDIVSLLTATDLQAVPRHTDLLKQHLDTTLFSEIFRQFLKNASLQSSEEPQTNHQVSYKEQQELPHRATFFVMPCLNFETISTLLGSMCENLSQLPLTHEQKRDLTCKSAQLISAIQQAYSPREKNMVIPERQPYPAQDKSTLPFDFFKAGHPQLQQSVSDSLAQTHTPESLTMV